MLGDVFFRRRAPSVLRGAVSCAEQQCRVHTQNGLSDALTYVSHDPLWKLERSSYIWLHRGREEREQGRVSYVHVPAAKQSLVYFALARQAVISVLIVGHVRGAPKARWRDA